MSLPLIQHQWRLMRLRCVCHLHVPAWPPYSSCDVTRWCWSQINRMSQTGFSCQDLQTLQHMWVSAVLHQKEPSVLSSGLRSDAGSQQLLVAPGGSQGCSGHHEEV